MSPLNAVLQAVSCTANDLLFGKKATRNAYFFRHHDSTHHRADDVYVASRDAGDVFMSKEDRQSVVDHLVKNKPRPSTHEWLALVSHRRGKVCASHLCGNTSGNKEFDLEIDDATFGKCVAAYENITHRTRLGADRSDQDVFGINAAGQVTMF